MEKEAVKLNEPNYRAVSKVMQCFMFDILASAFGDIPYHEACRGRRAAVLSRAFDSQEEVYRNILQELEAANTLFDTEAQSEIQLYRRPPL